MTIKEKLADIKKNPGSHQHSWESLQACCIVNGAFVGSIMVAHEGIYGNNGGMLCDVRQGPCSCGAWH